MGLYSRHHSDLDSPTSRLPSGMSLAGYDSDRQVYIYRDKDGSIWSTQPGNKYGELSPVSTSTMTRREEAMWAGGLQKQMAEMREEKEKENERERRRKERRKERLAKREADKQQSEEAQGGQRHGAETASENETRDGSTKKEAAVQRESVQDLAESPQELVETEYLGGAASVGILASPELRHRKTKRTNLDKARLQQRSEQESSTDLDASHSSYPSRGHARHQSQQSHSSRSRSHERESLNDAPPPEYLPPARRFTSFSQLPTSSSQISISSSQKKTVCRAATSSPGQRDRRENERETDTVLGMAGKLTRAVSVRVANGVGSLRNRERRRRDTHT